MHAEHTQHREKLLPVVGTIFVLYVVILSSGYFIGGSLF